MFWIIGADALVYAFDRLSRGTAEANADQSFTLTGFIATQLKHVDWAGFRFYDMIFPLFVFIMGVSLVFSLTKQLETGGRKDALKRLTRRFVLLFAIALLYSGGFTNPWPDMRLVGVLNRIALCYLFGGLIFIFFKPKSIAAITVALLVGYWAMMAFIPIRDIQLENMRLAERASTAGDEKSAARFREGKGIYENEGGKNFSAISNQSGMDRSGKNVHATTTATTTGKFEPGFNVANHFDFRYLPGKKMGCLLGSRRNPEHNSCNCDLSARSFLRLASAQQNHCDKWKLIYLFSLGTLAVILGFLWGLQFPVVKKIWSSSFVLVAGGYSAILLAIFYWMVDVMKWQTWCQPFVWMGMNSITIYVASNVIGGFRRLGRRFVGGDIRAFLIQISRKDRVIYWSRSWVWHWLFGLCGFLYRRKIFLRV